MLSDWDGWLKLEGEIGADALTREVCDEEGTKWMGSDNLLHELDRHVSRITVNRKPHS